MGKKHRRDLAEEDILKQLQELREALHLARLQFNQATEPEIVDACVYEASALQARYNYYLRLAREQNVAQSYVEQSRQLTTIDS